MDIKRLHEAIKELRDELDRVNLAIERIETIAEAIVNERQGQGASRPADESGTASQDEE